MRSLIRSLGPLVLVAAVGGALFYAWQSTHRQEPTVEPSPTVQASPAVPHSASSPTILYPVPSDVPQESAEGGTTQEALPPIEASDASIEAALSALFGKDRFDALFDAKDIARRIVTTIDGATGHKQPSREFSPLKPLAGDFRVAGKSDELTMAPVGFKRYLPYVDLVQAVDTRKLVAIYVHFYPLLQSAYRDLGTQGYFNDRLIAVIDDLLKAPDIQDSIKLVRPTAHSKYKFADDRLESLSAGQKALVRMGPENAKAIKKELRQIRMSLAHVGPMKQSAE